MASIINQKIASSNLLEHLRQNKNKYMNAKESKCLLSIYDQHVFVWHDAGSYILTSEIMNSAEKTDNLSKVLTLSNPPVFEVECMLFNYTGSLLALSGKNGVMIYEVPWRYGKFGASGVDSDAVLGRSWTVAEHFFACSNRVNVVQIAWHPGSPSNTHLTLLSTDNYIRIYDATDTQAPQQVIALHASTRSSYLNSESKIPFSACYGENAVSFDFGSPETMMVLESGNSRVAKKYEEANIWPIYLLHGNGDVCVVKTPLKTNRFQPISKVLGPLAMYPPSEDNYGYDACHILCLNTVPLCIVIATANGIMYHCIVLDSHPAIKDRENAGLDCGFIDNCDAALYVFESVELSLTLTEDSDDVFSHPIRLYKDITSQSKYHCTHVAGLHTVVVPFLQAIEKCIETDGIEKLLTGELKQVCIVEHILCTKPFSHMGSVPVLGLHPMITDAGVTMICLLASWEFVCLPLVSSYFSSAPHLLLEDLHIQNNQSAIPEFEKHIERVLQRSVCCPYLKSQTMDSKNTVPQQWLDLLCNVTQRFREDYVQKLYTAQALLRSRVKVLTQQKDFQLQDIHKSQQEKDTLKASAERLAEKYEDANTNQQKILKRLESTLLKFQQNLPYLSKAELNMKQTLLTYEDKLQLFEASLSQIKKKLKHQKDKVEASGDQSSATMTDTNCLNLTETQSKHVKELLMQEGQSIAELMKIVTNLKKQVSM